MPHDHARPHHSSQCGPVAARIAGVSRVLFHPVPVDTGHGGVWSASTPVSCLQMQKFWFRHICIVTMPWVVGVSPPVGFLPEGSCTFVQVHTELPLWALCGTSQLSCSSELHPFSSSPEKCDLRPDDATALRGRTTPSVIDIA